MAVTVAHTGIDVSEYKHLIGALRQASPRLAGEVRVQLRAAGEVVATEARRLAGEHSTSIPATIKTRTRGPAVMVEAGSADVPIARLFELGNVNRRARISPASEGGSFKHPVFGDRNTWVEQPMHRFLEPAAVREYPAVEALIGRALDAAVSTIVLGR